MPKHVVEMLHLPGHLSGPYCLDDRRDPLGIDETRKVEAGVSHTLLRYTHKPGNGLIGLMDASCWFKAKNVHRPSTLEDFLPELGDCFRNGPGPFNVF